MRTLTAMIVYDRSTGEVLRREKVEIMFTDGEPHPRDQVINIELPEEGQRVGRCINIGLRTLEKACGLKIKRVSRSAGKGGAV